MTATRFSSIPRPNSLHSSERNSWNLPSRREAMRLALLGGALAVLIIILVQLF